MMKFLFYLVNYFLLVKYFGFTTAFPIPLPKGIVAFHSFLVGLGCGSSLTSQHFGCPVSLNLGDQ